MKTIFRSSLILLCLFLASACGASSTPTGEVELSNVYTAAASTLAAQQVFVTPTMTSTALATQTPFSLPSSVPVTPTHQNTVSYASASTANGCNNALFISDVTISDETVLAPGEAFIKTWRFQNTGTCDWDETYTIIFTSGTSMDGETTEIDQDVSINATGDISVSLVAPESEGTYTGYWRLADDAGNAFGQSVYVMIVVSDDASTVTPTSTTTETQEEAESTATATSIPSPTVTSTTVPADTDTPVPTTSE